MRTTSGNANAATSSSLGSKSKRVQLPHLPRATLLPQAPGSMPLDNPPRGDVERLMRNLVDKMPKRNVIGIYASKKQIKGWRIPLTIEEKIVSTPIGITAKWVKFGKAPFNYEMPNLSGCTAVFIVVCIHRSCMGFTSTNERT